MLLSFADPRRFLAGLESLSYSDYSLAIKSGVHFTLCGGTVAKLGTAKHHESILPKLNTLELTGCFGMTELGHGSNVMGIETTVGAVHTKHECPFCTKVTVAQPCRSARLASLLLAVHLQLSHLHTFSTGTAQ